MNKITMVFDALRFTCAAVAWLTILYLMASYGLTASNDGFVILLFVCGGVFFGSLAALLVALVLEPVLVALTVLYTAISHISFRSHA